MSCRCKRRKLTIEERYGPSTGCILSPIMQIDESTSYNDFKIVELLGDKGSGTEQHYDAMVEAVKERE